MAEMAKRAGVHKSDDERGQARAKAGIDQARHAAVMESARQKAIPGPDAGRTRNQSGAFGSVRTIFRAGANDLKVGRYLARPFSDWRLTVGAVLLRDCV